MGEVKREPVNFDYEGLNWDFIKLQAEIAAHAKAKYGQIEQYADGRLEGEKSPLNHMAEHMRMYMAREEHDKFGTLKHQLAAIAYNASMEFYYLEHGGPTVGDKLYRKDVPGVSEYAAELVRQIDPTPSIIIPVDADESVHQSLIEKFFGGIGGGKSKGPVQ
jgi:hypothetical protein